MPLGFLNAYYFGIPGISWILFAILAWMSFRHTGKKVHARRERERGPDREESRMIQEMHGALKKMDERLEVLEDILLDRHPRR